MFGDRVSGASLPKFAWTAIVRHQLVPGGASPDDPDLAQYWADRRRKVKPPLDTSTLRLLRAQDGRCPRCGDYLLHADREPASPREWEQWLTGTRKAITKHHVVFSPGRAGTPDDVRIRLMHSTCRPRNNGKTRKHGALALLHRPSGLA